MTNEPTQTTLVGPDDRDIRTVVADPPWSCESGGGQVKRGADRHYSLLQPRQCVRVVQQECEHWPRVAESAHLYLWTTNNALAKGHAHHVARHLGFEPKTLITWVKKKDGRAQLGLGFYFRHCTEQILFCARGETRRTDGQPTTLLEAEREEHSAKPTETYEIIEKASPGEYLELFAREERDGWTCWGNEI